MTPHGTAEAWKKFLPHFLGFGIPFGVLAWFGGWSGAATLLTWRAHEEYLDWHEGRDTLAKAAIDLLSQTSLTLGIAAFRGVSS